MTTRFNLPPPNEGVDHIMYLRYGRADYANDLHPEYLRYSREFAKWHSNGKQGPPPLHWRKRVNDKWAGIYIWEDPDAPLSAGYSRPKLYEPLDLQDLLLRTPRVIRCIHAAVEQEASYTSMRQVYRDLLSVFRNEFQEQWQAWIVSSGNPEVPWSRTYKFLEQSTELIGRALILNYEMFPLAWSVNVMQYGEPSETWRDWLEHIAAKSQPAKIERLKHTMIGDVMEDDDLFVNCPIKFEEDTL